MPDKALHPTM